MSYWSDRTKGYKEDYKTGNYGRMASRGVKDYVDVMYMGGQSDGIKKSVGMDNSKQKAGMKKSARLRGEQYEETQGILDSMNTVDRVYMNKMNKVTNNYIDDVRIFRDEANAQAKDARKTYTNDIQPRYKGIMEDAQREARGAMTLREAGDPNNRVHQAVRAMYDQQAQNVGRQGLADVGVLNALGSQATAQQMGVGGPITGSQLQLLNAGNMQQSGAAYARAQQQMNRLREQGIERGFQESDAQYNRGQMAKDRYERSVGNFEGAMDRNISREQGLRDIRQGYEADIFGTKLGQARDNRDTSQGMRQRDLAGINQKYGGKQETIAQQIAMANAENAQRAQITGGILGAVGTMAGGYYGGPAGAQAGGNMGRSFNAPSTAPQQQGYGYNYQQTPQPQQQQQQQPYWGGPQYNWGGP